ncbi:lysine-sensitive aspartokinase 3 [Thaumasiovibrio subtropicus]|uniref:lysine-sensitive aspartokinase 3 n=1 Tax=Thaumasiovibrio subtropicus TaxID=1891207 RepID=UPI000B356F2D|nr:lysine-sensitive aspartokinase 3 [Thaumasiovibrio subtropicus]
MDLSSFTVAKFGGTSVADFDAMQRSANIVIKNPETKLVVISACSGVTNHLVELANGVADNNRRAEIIATIRDIHYSIIEKVSEQASLTDSINTILTLVTKTAEQAAVAASDELTDTLVSCGELMSTFLFTQVINDLGHHCTRFDIRQVMKTDSQFGKAIPDIQKLKTHAVTLNRACQEAIVVTQGFIGSDENGKTTTLGRGGSDYSAALIAEAVEAKTLEIWTDVPGIYTTDPRIASRAQPIPEISFSEASEMANFGAKILHPDTLIPAIRQHIPVFVGSSKAPEEGGTWVKEEVDSTPLFRALTLRNNQTMVTLQSLNMYHAYGFLAEVFSILAKYRISVDLITTSEVSVSLTLDTTSTSGAAPDLPEAAHKELSELCNVTVDKGLSLVAVIGNKMGQTKGTSRQIFNTLEDYNLRMICYGASQHNLCFLIKQDDAHQIIKDLHRDLLEPEY